MCFAHAKNEEWRSRVEKEASLSPPLPSLSLASFFTQPKYTLRKRLLRKPQKWGIIETLGTRMFFSAFLSQPLHSPVASFPSCPQVRERIPQTRLTISVHFCSFFQSHTHSFLSLFAFFKTSNNAGKTNSTNGFSTEIVPEDANAHLGEFLAFRFAPQ